MTETGKQIAPTLTRWGEPWNHKELCLNMLAILEAAGIDNSEQRVRMTAHAIVASGWRQNVWNFNAWGVKKGSWQGNYYIKGTKEADESGDYYNVPGAAWRAFTGWNQAIDDYLNRISPKSDVDAYKDAYQYLVANERNADRLFWSKLKGVYFTDQAFTPEKFGILCNRVRSELATSTEAQIEAAREFASSEGVKKDIPFLIVSIIVVVAALVAAMLVYVHMKRSL